MTVLNLRWLLPVALSAVIIGSFLNLNPVLPAHAQSQMTDALHFPTGVVLSLIAFPWARRYRFPLVSLLLAGSLLFGVIELLQPYFGRGASWGDWGFNLAGVGLGSLLALYRRPYLRAAGLWLITLSMQVWAAYPLWLQLHR